MSESHRYGDVVSRDGTDEHLVLNDCEKGDNVSVVCIKEPFSKWVEIGELEDNCEWRYKLLYKIINPEVLIKRIKEKHGLRY